jgi:hypothetical protein
MIRQGRLVLLAEAKGLKLTQRRISGSSPHSEKMVLVIARRENGLCDQRPTQGLQSLRMLKRELENNSRKPNNPTQQANGSLRKIVN